MSDSPKWTSVRVSPEVRRQLREERRRRREEQRARRAAERRRRREESFRSAYTGLRHSIDELEAGLQDFEASQLGQFASRAGIARYRSTLEHCESRVGSATDDKQLKPVRTELPRLRRQLAQLVAVAESQLVADQLEQEEIALRRLKQRLQSMGAKRSVKFDPEGLVEIDGLFSKVRQTLQRGLLEDARALLRRTTERMAEHEAIVEKRALRFEERKRKAETALTDLEEVIGGLRTDEIAMRWQSVELTELESKLRSIATEVQRGRFTDLGPKYRELEQKVKQLEQRAQQEQAKEEQRQYIVESMCAAMRKFGFSIESIQSAKDTDPRSDTIIYARRPSGGEIGVSVPQEGDVWYQLAGYPMRAHTTPAGGQTSRSCDEAEQELEALHELLKESFGIETGELMWRDKGPNRAGRHQQQLPDSTERQTDRARHR